MLCALAHYNSQLRSEEGEDERITSMGKARHIIVKEFDEIAESFPKSFARACYVRYQDHLQKKETGAERVARLG
jgi:hypothetical protein